MSIKLDDIEKKDFFKTPEGYFERLPFEVKRRLEDKNASPASAEAKWRWAIASVVIILAISWWFYPSPNLSVETPEVDLTVYSDETILNFLLESGVSSQEIITAVADQEILTTPIPKEELYILEEEMLEEANIFESDIILENI